MNDSIFINGNMARVLLASHELTGNTTHLEEVRRRLGFGCRRPPLHPPKRMAPPASTAQGLRWCDTFVGLMNPATTAGGEAAGFWGTGCCCAPVFTPSFRRLGAPRGCLEHPRTSSTYAPFQIW